MNIDAMKAEWRASLPNIPNWCKQIAVLAVGLFLSALAGAYTHQGLGGLIADTLRAVDAW